MGERTAAACSISVARGRGTRGVKERSGEGRKGCDWDAYQFRLVSHLEGCFVSRTRR